MQTYRLCFAALLVFLLNGCSRPPVPAELHWRFAGSKALQSQTNAPVLAEALKLPQAAAVTGPLAHRLAELWWQVGTGGQPLSPADAASGVALLPELLAQESVGQLVANPKGGPEFAVAIRGIPSSSAGWEQQWMTWAKAMHAARGGGGIPATLRQDGWLIAVSDSALLSPKDAWKQLSAYRGEPGAWAQFDLRYPEKVNVKAVMTGRDGSARWTATATLAKPMPAPLPAWEIPGGIREPLILLSAVRGVPSLVANLPGVPSWADKLIPSQLFAWGQPGPPESGHTYLAARMDNPKGAVSELNQRLAPLFKPGSAHPLHGQLNYDEKASRLTMTGLFPVTPTFEARNDGARPYLTFGFVPAVRSTNVLAPAMLAQIHRTNVFYYDWEFTSASALHWHLVGQLIDLLEGHHAVTSSPATQWLIAAAPKVGETVTEGLVTGPNTVTLQRKSPLGLSGLELAALARWIDPKPPLRRIPSPATNAPHARKKP